MDNTKQIGELSIAVGTMPAMTAVAVEAQLVKLCGPALFSALSNGKGKSEDEMGAAIVELLSHSLDVELLQTVIKTVFQFVSVDGERCNVDKHFTGRNKELWLALVFALRVNFSDFFPESLLQRVAGKVQGLSQ